MPCRKVKSNVKNTFIFFSPKRQFALTDILAAQSDDCISGHMMAAQVMAAQGLVLCLIMDRAGAKCFEIKIGKVTFSS